MIKRQYYGWYDVRQRVFRISEWPPDSPVRPSLALETKAEAMDFVKRKRAEILWWPELHPDWVNPPFKRQVPA